MARKSKKKLSLAQIEQTPVLQDSRIYRTALYARLSSEIGNEKDTIEIQLQLLRNYIDSHAEFINCGSFTDNGYTGTNFNRPGFQSLMEQVRAGNIDCILVKDLSRLGRNYIETGAFIERICPELNLRVISVDDGFDSTDADPTSVWNTMVALINVMNDMYAKDISRKISTTLQSKMERGEYIGNYAPYGYFKDPENKNHLIPDPQLTDTVVRIFQMRADGMGIGTIADVLNREDIPSPGRWRYEHGIITNNNKKGPNLLWNRHALKEMLNNEVYIGNLAQARSRQALHAGIPPHLTRPSEWVRAENTHEGIVPLELFKRVQEVNAAQSTKARSAQGKYPNLPHTENIYGTKLICADCGATMKLVRSISKKKNKVYFHFKCSSYLEHGVKSCTSKKIAQSEMDEAVLGAIQTHIKLFLHHSSVITLMQTQEFQKSKIYQTQKLLQNVEKQLEKQENLRTGLYMDWKTGLLTDEEYQFSKDAYTQKTASLQRRIKELRKELGIGCTTLNHFSHWKSLVRRHQKADHISRELIEAFVDTIAVSENETGIQLDIKLKFMDEFYAAAKAAQQYQEASA